MASRLPAPLPLIKNESHLVVINDSVHEGIIPHGQSPAVQEPEASYGVPLFLLLINIFMIVDPWSFPERVDNRSCF